MSSHIESNFLMTGIPKHPNAAGTPSAVPLLYKEPGIRKIHASARPPYSEALVSCSVSLHAFPSLK